MIEPASRPVW